MINSFDNSLVSEQQSVFFHPTEPYLLLFFWFTDAMQCLSGGGSSMPQAPQASHATPQIFDLTNDNKQSSKQSSSSGSQNTHSPKSLTSQEQVDLLQRTLSSNNNTSTITTILQAIKQHVDAEDLEERQAQQLGAFQWEYQNRNGQWQAFESKHNVTIESERRAGSSQAQIIDTSGQTITINFTNNRDSRGIQIRPMPITNNGTSASSSVSSSSLSGKASQSNKSTPPTTFHFMNDDNSCGACMSEFNTTDTQRCTLSNCQHKSVLCQNCMSMYISTKINEKQIFPWIKCPDSNCVADIACNEIVSSTSNVSSSSSNNASNLPLPLLLCATYLESWIARYPEWTNCCNNHCKFGFLVTNATENKYASCQICSTNQKVQRRQEEQDESLKLMIAEGKLRPCPKCQMLTMKEYGVCNVIECQQCSIVWNWRNRQTGRTTTELKQKARARGTLWEPGELQYQSNLQRTNKAEFVKLLERNGVKYDPNYRRGT